MTDKAEFERLLDVYGFRCERFGQDLSTHARAQVVSAFAALASAPDTSKETADKILRERMAPISEALGLDVMLASVLKDGFHIITFDVGALVYSIGADGTAMLRVSFNCPHAPDTLTVDQVKIISQAASEIQPAPQPADAPVSAGAQEGER